MEEPIGARAAIDAIAARVAEQIGCPASVARIAAGAAILGLDIDKLKNGQAQALTMLTGVPATTRCWALRHELIVPALLAAGGRRLAAASLSLLGSAIRDGVDGRDRRVRERALEAVGLLTHAAPSIRVQMAVVSQVAPLEGSRSRDALSAGVRALIEQSAEEIGVAGQEAGGERA